MSEEKSYKIRLRHHLIDVTKEVYLTYYRMRRYERFVEEQDTLRGVLYYSGLDTETMNGEEMLCDEEARSVEDIALDFYINEKLSKGIESLNETEQNLVWLLFFENMTEREAAASCGISQPAVHKCKTKILDKLRNYMNS